AARQAEDRSRREREAAAQAAGRQAEQLSRHEREAAAQAAMREADSVEPAKVTASLHRIRYKGISGTIAFDAQGNLRDPVFTL
ncbi:hypothetical protein ACP3XM_24790, partial [Salmonella enterica]